jgi:hypothetical protein
VLVYSSHAIVENLSLRSECSHYVNNRWHRSGTNPVANRIAIYVSVAIVDNLVRHLKKVRRPLVAVTDHGDLAVHLRPRLLNFCHSVFCVQSPEPLLCSSSWSVLTQDL